MQFQQLKDLSFKRYFDKKWPFAWTGILKDQKYYTFEPRTVQTFDLKAINAGKYAGVILEGELFPSNISMELGPDQISFKNSEHQITLNLTISIKGSKVSVFVHESTGDIQGIFNYAERAVHALVDALAFTTGVAAMVFLTTARKNGEVIYMNRRLNSFHYDFRNLSSFTYEEMCNIVLQKSKYVPLVLHNLNLAVIFRHDSAFFVYKAIELVKEDIGETKWDLLRERLRIAKPYLTELAEFSKSARHAVSIAIDGLQRQEMINRGWEVADRYFLYLCKREKLEKLPLLQCKHSQFRICLNLLHQCAKAD
jgi:hypothetical protein